MRILRLAMNQHHIAGLPLLFVLLACRGTQIDHITTCILLRIGDLRHEFVSELALEQFLNQFWQSVANLFALLIQLLGDLIKGGISGHSDAVVGAHVLQKALIGVLLGKRKQADGELFQVLLLHPILQQVLKIVLQIIVQLLTACGQFHGYAVGGKASATYAVRLMKMLIDCLLVTPIQKWIMPSTTPRPLRGQFDMIVPPLREKYHSQETFTFISHYTCELFLSLRLPSTVPNTTITYLPVTAPNPIAIDDRDEQSLGGGVVVEDLLQLGEEFGEGLGDEVSASGVVVGEVVGGLPLPNHVVSGGVVGRRVVVEDPALDQQVPETNAPGKSPQVLHGNIVPGEEVQQLVSLSVIDGEDVLAKHSGVIGPVGDGPRVVVAVESAVTHRYVISLYKIYLQKASVILRCLPSPKIHRFLANNRKD